MNRDTVLSRIAQLPRQPIAELKAMWGELFEKEPLPHNRNFLEGRIAYRLQEIAFGGIGDEALARLKHLCQSNDNDRARRRATRPPIGTVLVREYHGIEHRVRVLSDGFDYAGIKYRSLTAVAHKITGTSWNGLRFFGLKSEKVHMP